MHRPLTIAAAFALALSPFAGIDRPAFAQTGSCVGDINRDGRIEGSDLSALLVKWGPCPGNQCGADLTADGVVDMIDATTLLTNWGICTPSISLLMPANGPVVGGTVLTITGQSFYEVSSVTIGGVAAAGFTILSPTTMSVVVPPGTVGFKTVSITTPGGTVNATNAFRYTDPTWFTVLEQSPNPAVVTNKAIRQRIIEAAYPWRVRDNASGIEMLLVPPGAFQMGCSASNAWPCTERESPVHAVTLTSSFYVGRYEVTQGEWKARMGTNPSYFQPSNGFPENLMRPVESINYFQSQSFMTSTGLRFLTEAEWEYSCRAGTTTAFHSGPGFPNGTSSDALLSVIAWGPGSAQAPQTVGTRAANAFGLHDMLGNVFDWVKDWWDTYPSTPQINPPGPAAGTVRLLRGGAYSTFSLPDGFPARSSARQLYFPEYDGPNIGIRVARTP
ncbi:MAG: SUMF1/EgtB/PvdO family nonheme iron enzyme [Planctomycetaceae bacterium]|nr:SUMF1/EgtB/PvdO family nonheme iron enzyme [Planctomycetaceae bacterium]